MDDFKSADDFKTQCGYEIDDTWYPRVTKIVGIKAKPALYRFYASMPTFSAGERMKEESAKEGTQVHDTVEAILLGRSPVVPLGIQPSVEAFFEFVEKNQIRVNPKYVEFRLKHPEERYAGTLDAIAEIDGKIGILDIKTSQSIYRDYDLQTSAYVAAMRPIVPELETRWILRIDQDQICDWCQATLRKKGGRAIIRKDWANGNGRNGCDHSWGPMKGKIEIKECPGWENDFSAFLGAKRLWEWENEAWLKKINYL